MHMRIYTIILISLNLLVFLGTVAAQNPNTSFPDSAFGKRASNWFDAVNSGSEPGIREFIERNFSAEGKRGDAAAETAFQMRRIYEQSGGLQILAVTPPSGPYGLTITVKTRRGENYARIAIGEDNRDPGKIIGFGVWKIDPPNSKTAIDWPREKLTEKEMIAEIKRQVAKRVAEDRFSGVVLIGRDDKILLHVAHGLAERSFKVPNDVDTKFNLASVGKMFTATAIAQLVKEGKLTYETKLISVLPDFPNNEAAKKITIHQLLTHTAGMGTLFESPGYQRLRRYRSSWDQVSAFADEKLFFEPGTRWRYSNAGYVTLAAVVERLTGMTYLDYVRENIFKPLGMKDTDSYAHDEVVPNMSVLYVRSPDDPLGIEPYVADHILAGYRGNGEGGGYSTSMDLFRFARSYRTGKLLGPEAQNILVTPKVDEDGKGNNLWGYGVKQTTVNGLIVRGHSGGGRTHVQMIWESGYTVIVQTNTVPPPVTALSNEIVGFITQQLSIKGLHAK
jgi:D-alanyl-D-alanine carboxypeptidase